MLHSPAGAADCVNSFNPSPEQVRHSERNGAEKLLSQSTMLSGQWPFEKSRPPKCPAACYLFVLSVCWWSMSEAKEPRSCQRGSAVTRTRHISHSFGLALGELFKLASHTGHSVYGRFVLRHYSKYNS